ncbi:MAG: tRNA (adenosine(37)-N6)-threonylcarbamoyltransferase complex ATPase subunit type 1 TsaE [candidate division WOR-3 bacterium]
MIFETKSSDETIELGIRLSKVLTNGMVVGFFGELGSGKTTMIKGVAKGLGVKELVKSPSFVMVTEYQGRMPVYHIDLYRVGNPNELIELGLEQYLYGDGVSLIEWAERAQDVLPESMVKVKIEIINHNQRRIIINNLNQPI